jgi:D-inositol-3-phosphate glycosyltransferase
LKGDENRSRNEYQYATPRAFTLNIPIRSRIKFNPIQTIMQTVSLAEPSSAKGVEVRKQTLSSSPLDFEISLLTGCKDRPYVFGLAMALGSKDVRADIIGSDEIDSPELHDAPSLRFLNFRGSHNPAANFAEKLSKVLAYYARLIRYVARSNPKILHILWNNKFELFDRTILMLYYKVLGKRIAFTAHNVNQAKRDARDSWLNRVTLRIQYRLCDHIFVHTQKMKGELCRQFAVAEKAVTVIPFPINNASPDTELTSAEAKRRLGLRDDERAILFFGRVRPYKGTEHLLDAFRLLLANKEADYRLIIAGEPIKGCEEYLQEIQSSVKRDFEPGQVMLRMQFIPDDEVEVYLKAADVLVLPYKEIFQSGVLFLAYAFGLPVVATDVGSFREEIVEGSTGFLCKPGDPSEMARAIETYFASDLFKNLNVRRREIRGYANANHSWHAVAELTCSAYARILGREAT